MRLLEEEGGQSTVEYAIVLAAGLAMAGALGVMWHAARDGVFLRVAERACAYALGAGSDLAAWQDILLF